MTEDINSLTTKIAVMTEQITEGFKQNSKEHLDIMKSFKEGLDSKADKEETNIKIKLAQDTANEIKKYLLWIVGLVIAAVITAILSLILNK